MQILDTETWKLWHDTYDNDLLRSRAEQRWKQWCDACEEHRRPEGGPPATFDSEQVPWRTLGIDIKDYNDGTEKHKFQLMVDEATRFVRVALLFSQPLTGSKNATTAEIRQAFRSTWEEIFGLPAILRHDPEGAMMSAEFLAGMSSLGIQLSPTAGEAHWQLGLVERMIRTIFQTAERIMREAGVDVHEAVSLAVRSQNQVERVKGYSPAQWALGRQPTWTESLHDEHSDTVNLAREGTEAFAKRMEIQAKARAIAEEELLNDRLLRAQRARHRKDKVSAQAKPCLPGGTGWKRAKARSEAQA